MFNWIMGIGAAGASFMFWHGHGSLSSQALGWGIFIAAYPVALLAHLIFGKG